jgi:multidrug transporter EmrE-like cation transporter
MKWLILALAIGANASASVLVKMAMTPPRRFPSLTDPAAAVANWPLWLGLSLYGLGFFLYAASLVSLRLNVAYPVLVSGSVVAVALLSLLVFDEPFYWTTAAGIVMVMAGVALIVLRTA